MKTLYDMKFGVYSSFWDLQNVGRVLTDYKHFVEGKFPSARMTINQVGGFTKNYYVSIEGVPMWVINNVNDWQDKYGLR